MWQDIRLGARMLARQTGFTALLVVTLALGIGATTAVFSLIQGVLLTPPPYRAPERLVLIPPERTDGKTAGQPRGWPAAQWQEWRKEAKKLGGLAAYRWGFGFLITPTGSQSMEGMAVSRDYFRVLGLRTELGRTFSPEEAPDSGATASPVIVLGYDFWQRAFHGDRQILGKSIRMDRRAAAPVVIGVMQRGARFLPSPGASQEPNYDVNATVDYWVPATVDPKFLKDPAWDLVGRLQAGATLPQAESELTVMAAREAQGEPEFAGVAPRMEPLIDEMNRDGGRILLPLLGAAALVLLIACSNAAALLLVRGLRRRQEYAVRVALGVRRGALLRQAATESLLLAVPGGIFGMLLAFGAVRVFRQIGGHAIPRLDAVTTGLPVLACAFGAAILAALLAGLLPAIRASRVDPADALKGSGPRSSTGRGESRLLRAVTVFQTALTLALMVGAGLLVRTMINLSNVQPGYDLSRLVTMTVTSMEGDYSSFHRRALERIGSLPGVKGAAFAWGVPLTGNSWPGRVEMEGQPEAGKQSDRVAVPMRSVTPGYFALLGTAIAEGRDFRTTDDQKAPPVAIVNRALAERYFPHASAVGKKIWMGGRSNKPLEIAGVVSNGRTVDLTQPAEPELYLPLFQAGAFSKDLVLRTEADPRSLLVTVQKELRAINPTAAVEHIRTLERIRDDSLASRNFAMELLAGFAAVGVVLSVIGIYGLLSLSVTARRRELAIRSAVGAGQSAIRNLVLAEGLRLIAAGVVVGLVAGMALSRVFGYLLFGVKPVDPATFVAAGMLFTGVAVIALLVPARRAARVNPLAALRED